MVSASQGLTGTVLARLKDDVGRAPRLLARHALSGGSIHRVEHWQLDDGRHVVVKSQGSISVDRTSVDRTSVDKTSADIFLREAEGLRALAESGTLRLPRVLAVGGLSEDAPPFLALEHIETGSRGADFFEHFGRAFALHHRAGTPHLGPRGEIFGWHHDNVLGATPQPNPWCDDWSTFFGQQRLGHQLQLAGLRQRGNAQLQRLGERLVDRLGEWLDAPDEPASCLHGDLWGGNYLVDSQGHAVLIDPAVYCGRREADLAMTRLFGGFESPFYEAYEEVWPLADGSEERLAIYELYHLLNHLNLFGEGYLAGCLRILRRLV